MHEAWVKCPIMGCKVEVKLEVKDNKHYNNLRKKTEDKLKSEHRNHR